jgi:ribosome maturation factor RimP
MQDTPSHPKHSSHDAAFAAAGVERQKLEQVIEPIVRAHGAEIVDLEFKPEGGKWVLRVFVEKLGASDSMLSTEQAAIDLELCANVSREVSTALDVADLIPHRYTLEVSSPGVERALRGERDFVRFSGKKAKLKLTNAVRGQKVLVGVLDGLAGGEGHKKVSVRDGSQTYEIPLTDIVSARLVFEFGPAEKPGKAARRPRKT